METLHEFLWRSGVLDRNNKEEIEIAKKEYRKRYQREKQREYRRKNHRIEVLLTDKEKQTLFKAAKQKGMRLAPFVRGASIGYLDYHFILPEDSKVTDCVYQLRGVSNNLNQIIRYAHQNKDFTLDELNPLRKLIHSIEDTIEKALRQPLTLRQYIAQHLKENPAFLQVLETIIQDYKHVH